MFELIQKKTETKASVTLTFSSIGYVISFIYNISNMEIDHIQINYNFKTYAGRVLNEAINEQLKSKGYPATLNDAKDCVYSAVCRVAINSNIAISIIER